MGIYEKDKASVLSQDIENLLQDYYMASRHVEDLDYMSDYADYVDEKWWREIKAAINAEICKRCDKEETAGGRLFTNENKPSEVCGLTVKAQRSSDA